MKLKPEREKENSSAMLSLVVPGTVLGGKFQIVRKLGRGGMGLVIEAHHMELDERVALKFLQSTGPEDPVKLQRFYREARAAAKIKSEHVTRVLDVGKLDSGEPYMVLEHLSGIDLSKHLKIHGKLPITTAVDSIIQAMDAVAEAHANGIIHRDLKPSNLFLADRPDGTRIVKVLDFGIAKQSDGDGSGLTDTALVFGSMVYMSPEQTKSTRDVDERTDIYSLGITLFELCAGRPPFYAKLVPEIMMQKAQGNATPLRELVPSAPEALEKVLEKAYEREPDRRYVSIAAFAQALAPFASEESKHLLTRIGRVTEHTSRSFPRAKILPELREFAREIELELGGDSAPEPSPARAPEWSDEWSDEYSLKENRSARGKALALVKSSEPPSWSSSSSSAAPASASRPAPALPGVVLGIGKGSHSSAPPLSMAELLSEKAPSTARSPTFPPPPVAPVDEINFPPPPSLPAIGGSLAAPPPPVGIPPAPSPSPSPSNPGAAEVPALGAPKRSGVADERPSVASSDAADVDRARSRSRAVIVMVSASIAVGAGVGVFFGLRRGATSVGGGPDALVELRTHSLDNVVRAVASAAASMAPTLAPAAAPAPAPAPVSSAPRHPCGLGTKGTIGCASGSVAWCDTREERVACCDPALTPTGEGDTCGCPQGGPLLAKASMMGCKLAPDAPLLTPASIAAAFSAKQPELQACLPPPPPAPGKATTAVVVVALDLAPDGQVFDAHVQTSSTKNPAAEACVAAVARSIRFPPPPSRGMRFIQPLRILTAK